MLFALLLLLGVWLSYDRGLTSLEAWRSQLDQWQRSIGAQPHSEDNPDQPEARDFDNRQERSATEPLNLPESSIDPVPEPEAPLQAEDTLLPETDTGAQTAEIGPLPEPGNPVPADPGPESSSSLLAQVDNPVAEPDAPPVSTNATAPITEPDNNTAPLNLQITFEFDSDDLSAIARESLDEIASTLVSSDAGRVRVMGFADSSGDREYNIGLSRRRANAVAEYLVAGGVNPDFLEIEGLGIYSATDTPRADADNSGFSGRVVQLDVQFNSSALEQAR